MGYLTGAAPSMTPEILSCLTKLAERLGLPSLLESIANRLVTKSWETCASPLAFMTSYLHKADQDVTAFLHHPDRGACAELQVLQVLEDAGLSESAISDVVDVTLMGRSELDMLFRILLNEGHSSQNLLMRKALHRHLNYTAPQLHSNRQTSILDNIMMPDSTKTLPLPDSNMQLMIDRNGVDGESN